MEARRSPEVPLGLHRAASCRHSSVTQNSFEFSASAFVAAAFDGLNLDLMAWTRLPYLDSGGIYASHYHIDSALFVLRHSPDRKSVV